MTEKDFNDAIEKLSKILRKSFAETLRDLCNEAGIDFGLILKNEQKKEIMKKILERKESDLIFSPEKREEVVRWVETRSRGRKSD